MRFYVGPFHVAQRFDLDFVVEVANVTDNGVVFHFAHVINGDDVFVAGGGTENVRTRGGVFHGDDFVAFHGGLEGANGVDFGDEHAATGFPKGFGRTFTDVAVTADHGDFAGHHDIGGAADGINQAFAAAIFIVEFGFGDRVIDVDGRAAQLAFFLHLIQAQDAGGGFFGDAFDIIEQFRETFMHAYGQIAAVIEDHVGSPYSSLAIRAFDGLVDGPPEFLVVHAFFGKDRCACGGDSRSGVVLRGEDIAGAPAHCGTQGLQRFDEDGGLDGHVEATGNARIF